jgi:hypothetical protein
MDKRAKGAYPSRGEQVTAMAETDRGRMAAACHAVSHSVKGRCWSGSSSWSWRPWQGTLTQAAGDDFRTVLGQDEGVNERQIHVDDEEAWAGRQSGSLGSIFADTAAVHARRVEIKKVVKLPVPSQVAVNCFFPSRGPAVDVSEAEPLWALASPAVPSTAPSLCSVCEDGNHPLSTPLTSTSTAHSPSPPTARLSASASSTSTVPSALIRVL